MPFSHFILQGLSRDDDHIAGIDQVFSLNPFEQGIVATAFMNAAGASVLSDMIGPIADRVDVFIGIRNGVTSMQALDILLQNGIHPFVVHTASQAYIFHPKVYAANNHRIGRILVGSANVTSGGMAKNIEASLYHEVNMFDEPELVFSIYRQFAALRTEHARNAMVDQPLTATGIVTYIGKDIHGLPSFRLSDSVDGDCYVHACVKSEEEYTGIQVGDTITVTGNFHILSDDWGLVLKQSAVNQ